MFFDGLNPDVFFEWADSVKLFAGEHAKNVFHSIFKVFNQGIGYVYHSMLILSHAIDIVR